MDKKKILKLRSDSPTHENYVHFDNAGSSLMPDTVYNALSRYQQMERCLGGYAAQEKYIDLLQSFYTGVADLIGAKPSEIAYMESATRAWCLAFYGLPLSEGDEVITHSSEFTSNYLSFLQLSKRRGIKLRIADSDLTGQVDTESVRSLITDKTKVIAITHVPAQTGLINPVLEIGEIAKSNNLIYVLDACQSIGQLDVRVDKIGCDILTATGRKYLRGPRGTGFLYVSERVLDQIEPQFIDLSVATFLAEDDFKFTSGTKRFETYESNFAGRAALATAINYANQTGLKEIEERVLSLAGDLRKRLQSIPGIQMQDLGKQKSGIVTFTKSGVEETNIKPYFNKRQITISHIPAKYSPLDLDRRKISSVIRASVHYFNLESELDIFANAVDDLQ